MLLASLSQQFENSHVGLTFGRRFSRRFSFAVTLLMFLPFGTISSLSREHIVHNDANVLAI